MQQLREWLEGDFGREIFFFDGIQRVHCVVTGLPSCTSNGIAAPVSTLGRGIGDSEIHAPNIPPGDTDSALHSKIGWCSERVL